MSVLRTSYAADPCSIFGTSVTIALQQQAATLFLRPSRLSLDIADSHIDSRSEQQTKNLAMFDNRLHPITLSQFRLNPSASSLIAATAAP